MPDERMISNSLVAADAGLIVDREPQSISRVQLPEELAVVSADNHAEVTRDIFYENFPDRLRDKAPRVWFDKYWRIGFKGNGIEAVTGGVDEKTAEALDAALARSVMGDGFDFEVRNRHLAAEGIDKEIVYPQSLLAFVRYPDMYPDLLDLEMQELMYRTYNEYVADLGRQNPGRFYGVGICSNWRDPDKAESAVQQIVDLGLKSFMLPYSPGNSLEGKPLDFAGPEMDRLWAAAAEAGLPVSFHIGEAPGSQGPGAFGTYFIVQAAPFRPIFGKLVFGGILDRYPSLKVVFSEGGINWVAGALQDAELTYGAHREIYDYQPKHNPSYYWHQNMYATFQTDPIGLQLLGHLGADRVMWAQDYPHSEGTFGYTADALREILDSTSEADARRILGDNASELYKLENKAPQK